MKSSHLSRRNFLKISGLTTSAFSLGVYNRADAAAVISTIEAESLGIGLNAWMYISTAGKVTLVCHRAEMGQGVYQAIPQIIAEELEVSLDEVNVVFARGDNKKYGSQVTGGSSTVRGSYKNLLTLGATAREMLIEAGAEFLKVPKTECYAESGHVIHGSSGKKANYGVLIEEAAKITPPQHVKLKEVSEYKLIRKPLPRLDVPAKVNGEAIFGLDKRIPGMLFAAVERNPRLRGKVKSYDDSAALKVPGVKKVFRVKMGVYSTYREGVAVVATSTWAAFQGKKALKVEWDDGGFEHISSKEIYQRQQEALAKEEGLLFRQSGDPSAVIAGAGKKIDVMYQTPYQSHSCMEPLNCIAHYQPDKLEIWGPIQAPEWVQDYITREMGIPREKIIVNMTFLGGGFGRKAFMDYPHEAAVISKEMGVPVQVVWTREDDMTQGPYRPGISYRCEGVVENGEIRAMKIRMAGQNNDHWRGGSKDVANRSTSEGFLKPYFDSVKNISFADVPFETPLPTMWWRSVYASTNGFAFESFIDEMAAKAGKDPLEFRKQHLKDKRLHLQIDKIAEVSDWKKRRKNEGFGVAMTECFGSTAAHVVKVSKKESGGVKIDKVWVVMDCGWYVNPDTIRAQIEGSVVMALGAATLHEITFTDGITEQQNFHQYLIPRITDIPEVEVHIMENHADAGGVGEPGLPPFAPALTNAIFDLTGKRIRKLPFSMDEV
ncbi:molybdopterin-dependent oxidoreductase [Emticicia sp. CRIBPO]|uniref:xanthine dehydrogenase family protein molybdopterin-binding subunit n=1 Tax=Emticicia sp. CRIBPO TaxID=2683258 RepID=UPI0014125F39|nr:molybdopterin cofactor-binding domain-containing protein [Emticicia sp. CRIBPO]NBA84306.1 molybdopterin-dependent oxidoreductase [Emticicia sp. CRIBPO]